MPRQRSVLGLAACILVGLVGRGWALDPDERITQYMHRSWGSAEGLPMNTASTLAQTPDGYLWIGSQEGLVRYDGVTFTLFNKRNTPCLDDQWILRLSPMPDGSVWVIPLRGAPVLLTRDGLTCPPVPVGVPNRLIKAIVPAPGGGLWIAAFGEGVFRVERGRLVRRLREAPGELSSAKVLDLAVARDGSVWVATDGGGVNHIRNDGTVEVFDTARGLASDAVVQVRETTDGRVWVGTAAGVDVIAKNEIEHVAEVPAALVNAITEDRNGSLWFGTEDGLYRLHDGAIARFTDTDGLSARNVRTLLEDREGSLWIGTYGGGIDQLSDGLFTPYSEADGLSDDFVWSVFEDRPGRMWIGTESGGLNRLEDGVITTFGRAQGLGDDTVRAIHRDRAGALWVGTRKAGLKRWDGARFTSVASDDPRCDSDISAIAEDADGVLWVGSRGRLANQGATGILCRMVDGRLQVATAAMGGLEDLLSCMRTSRDGRLLLCGTRGLYVVDRGVVTTYSTANGLSSDFVTSVHEDADGALWIGTAQSGLNRLKDGVIAHASTADGLFDDKTHAIVEDRLGYLWMSSNRGISRVSKRELDDLFAGRITSLNPTVYGSDKGMRSAECNGAAQFPAWRASDGRLWFATMKGAVVVDPDKLATNPVAPEVLIERFAVDGAARALGAGDLILPAGTRAIEFTYTATSLIASEQIPFRYKLQGFDDDWTDAAGERTRHYTNLPPGQYRFQVIAANSDGVWNEVGAAVGFTLEARFHQTWWFLLSCMAAILAAIYGAHRLRVNRLRQRERSLQQRVADRTHQIAAAAQALRASEAYGRAILGNVGEAIITFDDDGHISGWNRAAERIFEHTADEAIGATAALIGLEDAVEATTGAVVQQARRKDGAVIPVEIQATATTVGGAGTTIWLVRDMTEPRRAEAKVAEIQRELLATSRRAGMAQVATSVIHNVGNALNGVNLSADLLLATLRRSKLVGLGRAVAMVDEDPAKLARFLTTTEKGRQLPSYLVKVNRAVQRERQAAIDELESMEKGIEHIKAIIRSQQSHARTDRVDEHVALPDLLADAIRFERAMCEAQRVTVKTEVADLPTMAVDRHRLLEIVMNLLVNAREAVVLGGGEKTITVSARTAGPDTIAIGVADTGAGIAPENLVKIFSQGFTTKPHGHGFGLHGASCSAIEMGGTLTVESEGLGKGARFGLTLPVGRAGQAGQADRAA